MRTVLGHQGHEGLQGFVPKRGACQPLIISNYIDHLALRQGFTYLINLKNSLTSLALAMFACVRSLFVNSGVCSKPCTGAQPKNEPPTKEQGNTEKKNAEKIYIFVPRRGGGRCAE